jgi:hypothetical protein
VCSEGPRALFTVGLMASTESDGTDCSLGEEFSEFYGLRPGISLQLLRATRFSLELISSVSAFSCDGR